jgi:hypothetical protein
MSKYDLTAIAIEELRAFGIEPTQIRRSGSGHYKYSFVNDTERFIVVAATPSDCRAQDNIARWCAESFAATELL